MPLRTCGPRLAVFLVARPVELARGTQQRNVELLLGPALEGPIAPRAYASTSRACLASGFLATPHRRPASLSSCTFGAARVRDDASGMDPLSHGTPSAIPLPSDCRNRQRAGENRAAHPAPSTSDQRHGRALQPHPARQMPRERGLLRSGCTPTNHHRCHTALGGLPPMSCVDNLSGQYS